jgi:hypothetical protein
MNRLKARLETPRHMIRERTERIKKALSSRNYDEAVQTAIMAFRDYPAFLVQIGATRKETAYTTLLPDDSKRPTQGDYPNFDEAKEDGVAFLKRVNEWTENQQRRPHPTDPRGELEYLMAKAEEALACASARIGKDFDFKTGLTALQRAYAPDPGSNGHRSCAKLKYPLPYMPQAWPCCMDEDDWRQLLPDTKDALRDLRHALSMMEQYASLKTKSEMAGRNAKKTEPKPDTKPETTAIYTFRKTSAGFEMYFDSVSVDIFPNTVGTRCLHVLLSNLGKEFSTLELHSALNPPPPEFAEYRDTMEHETLTRDARKRLLATLNNLKEEHRHCTDYDHRDSLADKIRKIEKYLEKSTTGHPRTTERGTQHFRGKGFSHGNYQKRIREAIAKIKRNHKDAGAYLDNSIIRGTNNVFQYHGERRWQT